MQQWQTVLLGIAWRSVKPAYRCENEAFTDFSQWRGSLLFWKNATRVTLECFSVLNYHMCLREPFDKIHPIRLRFSVTMRYFHKGQSNARVWLLNHNAMQNWKITVMYHCRNGLIYVWSSSKCVILLLDIGQCYNLYKGRQCSVCA